MRKGLILIFGITLILLASISYWSFGKETEIGSNIAEDKTACDSYMENNGSGVIIK